MSKLSHILQHIKEIAAECGRDPNDIQLVAVTKTHPWEQIASLYEEGCLDFGESRVQEAFAKRIHAPEEIRWHLIGSLQKNKVRKVIGQFSLIHSVDSYELAEKISTCSQEVGLKTAVLIQVNTSHEASKHGLTCEQWRSCFDELLELPALSINGLMTMGPHTDDKERIRESFSTLRHFRDELKEKNPTIQHLSMGMSHDYPFAIQEGATLLRIGTALFS